MTTDNKTEMKLGIESVNMGDDKGNVYRVRKK